MMVNPSTTALPPWVQALGSVTPLVTGIAGILVERKRKSATETLRHKDLLKRVDALEKVQANHVVAITKMQQTISYVQRTLGRIEDVSEENGRMIAEVRGMLYQLTGNPLPPSQPPLRRRYTDPPDLDTTEPVPA